MKGICIDPGNTTTLKINEEYYLFENGQDNFYVSRFDNPNAHFGSFQKKYFKVVNKENMSKKNMQLNVARVCKPHNGYRVGEKFIIGPSIHEPYFDVFLYDYPERGPIGSYINNFFEVLEPFKEPEEPKWENNQLVMVIDSVKVLNLPRSESMGSKPKKLTKYEQLEEKGQLSLFDL
ncbi:hypothetical protein [Heyndrickxia ginsengihumi]|uniref:hypothetical protein n=1 Tax=Heyndrickxia ginsengihumi TaxID=363870 RepID=UPI0004728271|nr:hypothetical protein [Heyndrickxia ginsengihumi]